VPLERSTVVAWSDRRLRALARDRLRAWIVHRKNVMLRSRILLFGLAVGASQVLCASAAAAKPLSTKVTERVVGPAIDSGLEALARPENQQRLGAVLSSVAVTGGAHDIALAVVDGVLDGVEGRVTIDFDAPRFWKSFDVAARKHVGPATGVVTRNVVESAMATAFSEENGMRVEEFTAHATRGAIKGLAVGIREDLGPALAHVVEHQLAPAGAAALEHHVMPAFARALAEPEMQVAIRTTMSSMANALVRGGDAGMEGAKAAGGTDGEDGVMKIFGDRLSLGFGIAFLVTCSLAAVLILLAVLLVRSNRGQQRLAEQGKRREVELLTIVDQLDDTNPIELDKKALRDRLKQQIAER
jgi:hypothetical protein